VRRSRSRQCCIFTTLEKLEVPASVEVIDRLDFYGCQVLVEISFVPDGKLCEIRGFQNCVKLAKVGIPASVFLVSGFNGCVSLRHLEFEPRNHAIRINRFSGCDSLDMIANRPGSWRLCGARVLISFAEQVMRERSAR
jgi:hypothetical protein